MESLARVVVVASLNYDITAESPHIPRPGETVLGTRLRESLGGKGGNQAVAMSRIGLAVSVVGCVGNDSAGQRYRDAMISEGMDVLHVAQVSDEPTGTALIVVAQSASNSIVVIPGANTKVDAKAVQSAASTIEGADIVVAQLETPLDGVRRAFEIAHANGVLTLLNPAPFRPLEELAPVLRHTDFLVPNEIEFAQMLKLRETNIETMAQDADPLFKLGVRYVVVTLGPRGAALVSERETQVFDPLDVPVIDTTAAGDSFIAGLVRGLATSSGLTQDGLGAAIEMGTAVAAHVVGRPGAQSSLPTAADLGW